MNIKLIWALFFFIIRAYNSKSILKSPTTRKTHSKMSQVNDNLIIATEFQSFIDEYDCSRYLKGIDNDDWKCKMEYKRKKPFYCSCSSRYDCTSEEMKNSSRSKFNFYFSAQLLKEIKIKNKLNNINRGADHQCEVALNRDELPIEQNNLVISNSWKCSILRNKNKSMIKDEEFFCECFYRSSCSKDQIIFI
jgi:hypothetical protein